MTAPTRGARWERTAQRVVAGLVAGCGLLLVLGMILSYSGLRSFYLSCGLPAWAASVSPLCVDLLALAAYVALVALAGSAARYAGAVVAATVVGSAAAQGYHLSHGGIAARVTDPWIVAAAGASAMVCAGLAGHLLFLVLRRALPADFITALAGPAVQADLNPAPTPSTGPPRDLNPEGDRKVATDRWHWTHRYPVVDIRTGSRAIPPDAPELLSPTSWETASAEQIQRDIRDAKERAELDPPPRSPSPDAQRLLDHLTAARELYPDPGIVSTGDPKVATAEIPRPTRISVPVPPIPADPPTRGRRTGTSKPIGRGSRGGTSQVPAPCVGCSHHAPAELVSRSARSRCRTGQCGKCRETAHA